MTKFVLHGGHTNIKCENNKNFFSEMLKNVKDPKILLVYFSRPKEEWEKLEEQDKNNFGKGKFTIADKQKFEEQIKGNDIIYLRGGNTFWLLKELKKVNFKDLIKGKVIGGSSAGVYVLVKYFYNETTDRLIRKGLGILNLKAMCHYSKDRENQLKLLKKYGEKIETIILKDTEFRVINC